MLQVREQQQHQTKVLVLTEQFDRRTTPGLQVLILAAQNTGCHHIVLDFSGVTEIDSTSLSNFFLWCHNMRSTLAQISIVKPTAHLQNHLDWAHLSEIVPIYEAKLRPWGTPDPLPH